MYKATITYIFKYIYIHIYRFGFGFYLCFLLFFSPSFLSLLTQWRSFLWTGLCYMFWRLLCLQRNFWLLLCHFRFLRSLRFLQLLTLSLAVHFLFCFDFLQGGNGVFLWTAFGLRWSFLATLQHLEQRDESSASQNQWLRLRETLEII